MKNSRNVRRYVVNGVALAIVISCIVGCKSNENIQSGETEKGVSGNVIGEETATPVKFVTNYLEGVLKAPKEVIISDSPWGSGTELLKLETDQTVTVVGRCLGYYSDGLTEFLGYEVLYSENGEMKTGYVSKEQVDEVDVAKFMDDPGVMKVTKDTVVYLYPVEGEEIEGAIICAGTDVVVRARTRAYGLYEGWYRVRYNDMDVYVEGECFETLVVEEETTSQGTTDIPVDTSLQDYLKEMQRKGYEIYEANTEEDIERLLPQLLRYGNYVFYGDAHDLLAGTLHNSIINNYYMFSEGCCYHVGWGTNCTVYEAQAWGSLDGDIKSLESFGYTVYKVYTYEDWEKVKKLINEPGKYAFVAYTKNGYEINSTKVSAYANSFDSDHNGKYLFHIEDWDWMTPQLQAVGITVTEETIARMQRTVCDEIMLEEYNEYGMHNLFEPVYTDAFDAHPTPTTKQFYTYGDFAERVKSAIEEYVSLNSEYSALAYEYELRNASEAEKIALWNDYAAKGLANTDGSRVFTCSDVIFEKYGIPSEIAYILDYPLWYDTYTFKDENGNDITSVLISI